MRLTSHLALEALHHVLDVAQGIGGQVLGQHTVKLLMGHQQPQDLSSIVPAQSDQASSVHSLAEKHRHRLFLLLSPSKVFYSQENMDGEAIKPTL